MPSPQIVPSSDLRTSVVPPHRAGEDDASVSAWAALVPESVPTGFGAAFEAAEVPAILDIEASGFGRSSYPIEVGFVLEDGRSGCTLIRPEADWTHWDAAAQRTHGIRRELLFERGRSVAEVARWLNLHLAGRVVYSDGWAHDYPWLARLFDAAGVSPHFRLGHLRALLDDDQASRWQLALDDLRRTQVGQRHRASVDARQIRAALAATMAATAPKPRSS